MEKWGVLVFAVLGAFTIMLNNSVLNPAIPTFVQTFGIKVSTAGWIISAYMIALATAMLLSRFLSSLIGPGRAYVLGIATLLLASVLGALSGDFQTVVAARGLQGIGGGLVTPLSLTFVYHVFPRTQRGVAAGLYGVAITVAPALGPLLGGVVIENVGWRALFLLNLPSGAACLVLFVTFVRSVRFPRPPLMRFDLVGFVLLAGALSSLLVGTSLLADARSRWWGIGLACGGATLLTTYIRVSSRSARPLLPLRVFADASFRTHATVIAVYVGNMFAGVLLVPFLVQDGWGASGVTSGTLLFAQGVASAAVMVLGGRVLDRAGSRGVVTVGLITAGAMSIAIGMTAHTSIVWLLALLLIGRGVGMGLLNPAITAGVNALPARDMPHAVMLTTLVQQMSGAFFSVSFALLYEVRSDAAAVSRTAAVASQLASRDAFLVMGGMFLAVVPYFVWSRTRATTRGL